MATASRRLAALAWLAICLIPFAALAQGSARPDDDQDLPEPEELEFGDFTVTVREQGSMAFVLDLAYQGRPVLQAESFIADPRDNKLLLEDFPVPGSSAMVFNVYSGGAHCCNTAIVLTLGPGGPGAMLLAMDNSGLDVTDHDGDGRKEFKLTDWSFAFYNLDREHSLCFACSPGFRRYVLLDPEQGWRADAPGEFADVYRDVLPRVYDTGDPAFAIRLAYYTLMAGGSADGARQALQENLPLDWRDKVEQVLADVQDAVHFYNPITVIELP